jgi:chromosome segregation ATPase
LALPVGCGPDSNDNRILKDEKALKQNKGNLAECKVELGKTRQDLNSARQASQASQQGCVGKIVQSVAELTQMRVEISNLVPREVRQQVDRRVGVLVDQIGALLERQGKTATGEHRRILQELAKASRVQERLDARDEEIKRLQAQIQGLSDQAERRDREIAERVGGLIGSIRSLDERIDCKRCKDPVPITGLFGRREESKKALLDFHRQLLQNLAQLLPRGTTSQPAPDAPLQP